MRIIFLVIACILFIVSCGELSGVFNVNKNITLIAKNNKNVEIASGSYSTKIKFNQKKSRVEVVVNKNTFYFIVPEAVFEKTFIPSSDNGQPYDVSIDVTKETTASPLYYDYETCLLGYENSYVCEHHDGQCSWITYPINGIRRVDYHYEYYTIKTKGTLLDNSEEMADFNAIRKETERVIDFVGFCH